MTVVVAVIAGTLLLASVTLAGATLGAGGSRATQCVILLTNISGNDLGLKSFENGPGDIWHPKPSASIARGSVNHPITAVDEQGHGCRASVVYHLNTRSCDNSDICDFHLSIALEKKDSDHFAPEVSCKIAKERLVCSKLFTRFERRDLQVGLELSTRT
jgi:hypothetical protein